jgi:hypothetical protein
VFKPLGSAWGFLSRFCCQGNTIVAVAVAVAGVVSHPAEVAVTHQLPHPVLAKTYTPAATLGQINAFLATVPGDGAASVLLPSGKVLWVFGDTLDAQGGHNTSALQSGSSFSRRVGELKPSSADGLTWYWPSQPVMDGGTLVIMWARMQSNGAGQYPTQTATVVDTYNPATLTQSSETVKAITDPTSTAVLSAGSWWIYGTKDVGDGTHRKAVTVRKASTLTGGWGATKTIATQDWAGGAGSGTFVSVLTKGTGVQVWTKAYDFLTNNIVTATAAAPDSTLGAATVVAQAVRPGQTTYTVCVHPEQQPKGLLTYSTNGSGDPAANHPYALVP